MDELKITALDELVLEGPLSASFLPFRAIHNIAPVALGIATGWVAWNCYLPVAIFLPVIWVKTSSKKAAWLVGLGYHLAASRGLITGVPIFFDSTVFYGMFLWAMAGLVVSLPYYIFSYVRNPYLSIVLLLSSLILPPIGIVGFANPLTAAGLIFPGTGFAGLFLSLVLIFLAVWLSKKNRGAFCLIIALVLFLPEILKPSSVEDDSFKGISTHFSGNPTDIGDKFFRDYQKFTQIYNDHGQTDFKILALPEASAGIWFDSTKDLWGRWQKNLKNDQNIIILSTLLPVSKMGLETYNTLIEMKKDGFTVLYKARQSVPIAMWNPWRKDNVKNNWFGNPVFEVAGKKATALICYEAYLTWPILQSFLSGDPETIFFAANHWWSKDTSLLRIQEKCVSSWARLFNVQLISAVNY